MKKMLIATSMLLLASFANAKDDCPSAADAAEAQNPNLYKDCDYSNTGLTLAVKKAFGATKEPAGTKEKIDAKDKVDAKEVQLGDVKPAAGVAEFSTAQQLSSLRFSLIAKLAQECSKGFVIDAEKYLPTANKSLTLELQYHCL